MQKKVNQATFAVMAMMTIWLVIHTVKLNTIVPDYTLLNKTMNTLMNRVLGIEEYIKELKKVKEETKVKEMLEEHLDSTESFGERFSRMRAQYGSGYVFNWNDRLFTTHYAEEVNYNEIKG